VSKNSEVVAIWVMIWSGAAKIFWDGGGYTPPIFFKSAQAVCFIGDAALPKMGVR
jgi:hypothetical protein